MAAAVLVIEPAKVLACHSAAKRCTFQNASCATSTIWRRARWIDSPHWSGSVFRATWLPFAAVMGLIFLFGTIAQSAAHSVRGTPS